MRKAIALNQHEPAKYVRVNRQAPLNEPSSSSQFAIKALLKMVPVFPTGKLHGQVVYPERVGFWSAKCVPESI